MTILGAKTLRVSQVAITCLTHRWPSKARFCLAPDRQVERDGETLKNVCRNCEEILFFLYTISLTQHTRGFSNAILGSGEKKLLVSVFFIIDSILFIVSKLRLCVIEFSQKKGLEKKRRKKSNQLSDEPGLGGEFCVIRNIKVTLVITFHEHGARNQIATSCERFSVQKVKENVWRSRKNFQRDVTSLFETRICSMKSIFREKKC